MLTDYNIITFKGLENDTICEINLPKEKKDTIKLTIAGNSSYIKIKDFYGICVMLVKGKLLDSIIPDVERKVKKYKRQLTIIANKDIKKGERIVATYEVDIPRVITDNYDTINFSKK